MAASLKHAEGDGRPTSSEAYVERMATAHRSLCEPVIDGEVENTEQTSPCDQTAEGPPGKLLSQHSQNNSEKLNLQLTPVSQTNSSEQARQLDQDSVGEPILSARELKNVQVLTSPSEDTVDNGIATPVPSTETALLTTPAPASFCVDPGHCSGAPTSQQERVDCGAGGEAEQQVQEEDDVHEVQPKHIPGATSLYGITERQTAVQHELLAAAAISDHRRHVENQFRITVRHDHSDSPVVNLRRAGQFREARHLQDFQSTRCRSCLEEKPEVSVLPCGHEILCPRCFLDPYSYNVLYSGFPCPVCRRTTEKLCFTDNMSWILYRRM